MNSHELIDIVEATEWYVYLLSLDECSPHALLGVGAVSNDAKWQFAVDLTLRCLVSGVWMFSVPNILDELGLASDEEFCARLSQFDPFALSEDGEKYWLDSYMVGSSVSSSMVSRCLISAEGPVFASGFFEEIDRLFSMSGVAWREGSLISISS
ncbi:hypothetical protein [Stenotrophomonas maltophilia]|uniref:hypothetical protein n=1 Tax=Stenotrophomonas maltophilia TaxID=40324 RepID=UPI0012FDD0EC|nr:hypothetical protein [Stenotrophomonas maltophilia]MCU1069084.1 hypothetical protein [Stenotrophomonas maltophilia]MCU1074387.1 hypothetical protein [Stenotrophomonas maltophilia]MCU1138224.1 hypothetical protein [Stenotrophomonas maltophilia]